MPGGFGEIADVGGQQWPEEVVPQRIGHRPAWQNGNALAGKTFGPLGLDHKENTARVKWSQRTWQGVYQRIVHANRHFLYCLEANNQ
jgi:hypothetical protein